MVVGRVTEVDERSAAITVHFGAYNLTLRLGLWWLAVAQRGGVERLPFINLHAQEAEPKA